MQNYWIILVDSRHTSVKKIKIIIMIVVIIIIIIIMQK